MQTLLTFLSELEKRKVHFTLEHNSAEAIMVLVAVPGERWEIEFFSDGTLEVEIFSAGTGVFSGARAQELVQQLLARESQP
jgi:hypothetical protein